MTEEIKEILDKLKDNDWYEELDLTGTKWIELKQEETNQLLNYITNLQKENTDLKELCDKYEEEHSKAFKLWTMKMEEMPDYEERMNYKSRNKKAIEYIKSKKAIINTDYIRIFDLFEIEEQGYTKDLLNILKGGDE